eukprot:scaffold6407_cov62-Phaeocystis_antarctica.AAC.7
MHTDSHLVVPYMLPSFANALCQRWHQRPERGRLSVGSQSTTFDDGGTGREKAPKIEGGTEAAPLPRWSSATLVSLLVPPATVSRAPATSYAGCEWGGGVRPPAGGGMKVEGDHRKVNRAAAEQVLLSAQACAQRRSAGR